MTNEMFEIFEKGKQAFAPFGDLGEVGVGTVEKIFKLETEIAISHLLRRFPDFDGPLSPSDWRRSMIVRGPVAVPMTLA